MSSINNPVCILKGRIDITDDLEFVLNMIQSNNNNLIIINLDEYNNQIQGDQVIQGAELLPPPGAVIAEQDGDPQAYDFIYESWYNEPSLQLFITGIITTLYRGKSVLLYYPELFNQESVTMPKMFDMFWRRFGIRFGIVFQSDPVYDFLKTPVWLSMMYSHRVIGAYEFLIEYPDDAVIQASEMNLLVQDIRPLEQDPVKAILEYQRKIKEKPKTIRVFFKV